MDQIHNPKYNVHFWTSNLLSKEELEAICTRLMNWQKACVMADTLISDMCDPAEYKAYQEDMKKDKALYGDIQALVRHIGALTSDEKDQPKD